MNLVGHIIAESTRTEPPNTAISPVAPASHVPTPLQRNLLSIRKPHARLPIPSFEAPSATMVPARALSISQTDVEKETGSTAEKQELNRPKSIESKDPRVETIIEQLHDHSDLLEINRPENNQIHTSSTGDISSISVSKSIIILFMEKLHNLKTMLETENLHKIKPSLVAQSSSLTMVESSENSEGNSKLEFKDLEDVVRTLENLISQNK